MTNIEGILNKTSLTIQGTIPKLSEEVTREFDNYFSGRV